MLNESVFESFLFLDYDQLNTEDPHPVSSSIVPAPMLSNIISDQPSTSLDVVAAPALLSFCKILRKFQPSSSGNKTFNRKIICKTSEVIKLSGKQSRLEARLEKVQLLGTESVQGPERPKR